MKSRVFAQSHCHWCCSRQCPNWASYWVHEAPWLVHQVGKVVCNRGVWPPMLSLTRRLAESLSACSLSCHSHALQWPKCVLSGGFRGCKCTPLWRLVMYFSIHNWTSPSNDYAAVACSNNNQAQLHTHVSVHYWSPDVWPGLESLQNIQFVLPVWPDVGVAIKTFRVCFTRQ